ncbi:MAG: PD-(D/E)XK nuclease family protein [Firmicutes bacterium]|nr:PD-(D/E)XK nuclease family protein [Bacillota bacterium]
MSNKLYLSNSSIKTFLKCKQKFKFKHIDKIDTGKKTESKYMSFGNSMHAALADYNNITNPQYKTLKNLHNLLRKNWIREGYETIEEEKSYGEMGLNMLTQYYNDRKDKEIENYIIEDMVFKNMKDYVLCGKLDKVYLREDKKVEVLDYKTGKTSGLIDKIQLPIYLILTKEKLNYYPDIISIYYLKSNKKLNKALNKDTIKKATESILKLCEVIKNEKNYDASPNAYCKKYCEYFDICEAAKNKNQNIINELDQLEKEDKLKTVF